VKWIAKALVQKSLDLFPNPAAINFFLQRHVSKSLPPTESHFFLHLEEAFNHYKAYSGSSIRNNINDIHLYEFGAGWDLTIPLAYAAMGARKQTVTDLMPHFRPSLLKPVLANFNKHRALLESRYNTKLSDDFFFVINHTVAGKPLLAALGIEYRAPVDARRTTLEAESVDFITSTSTLEHIPAPDITKIMAECTRILRPGGCVSCIINLEDHYSHFDRAISPYNFLKYSEGTWNALFNSSMHYQNRLRVDDYMRMFSETELKIVLCNKVGPSDADRKQLESIRLHGQFTLTKDVGVRCLMVLLEKPNSAMIQTSQPKNVKNRQSAGS
jgi:hypothetical protein